MLNVFFIIQSLVSVLLKLNLQNLSYDGQHELNLQWPNGEDLLYLLTVLLILN